MTPYLLADARVRGSALHHQDGVVTIHGIIRQLSRSSLRRAEEGTLFFFRNRSGGKILMEVIDEIMMREHLMELAALFVKTHLPFVSRLVEVLDLHVDHGTHTRKRVNHNSNECPVA